MSLSRPARLSRVSWQAASRDNIAGREDVGIELFKSGAQAPAPNLCALARPLMEHGICQRLSVWPFPAVPALSPTTMCSHMLAGASATSSTIGNVVEDVETVVGASVFDALALEATIVHCAYILL